MSNPAGWYPDPASPSEEILWDGEAWTGLRRPVRTNADAGGLTDSSSDRSRIPMTYPPSNADTAADSSNEIPVAESSSRRRTPLALWKRLTRPLQITVVVVVAVVLVLIASGVVVATSVQRAQQEAEAKERAAESRALQREQEEAAEEQAQIRADETARAERAETVTEIESSVKKLAEKHVGEGLFDGPVLTVSCSPVGGSADDLSDTTTTFDCFVATKDNGDGTNSGYYYNATVNWNSGEYTYGYGRSNG